VLKQAEEFANDNSVFMTKSGIKVDAILTHARLAKVYAAAGQNELRAQEIAEALKIAREDRTFQTFTNESALAEFVKHVDENARK